MKYEVDADPQQVVQILEGIERVADLLGINASAYGHNHYREKRSI